MCKHHFIKRKAPFVVSWFSALQDSISKMINSPDCSCFYWTRTLKIHGGDGKNKWNSVLITWRRTVDACSPQDCFSSDIFSALLLWGHSIASLLVKVLALTGPLQNLESPKSFCSECLWRFSVQVMIIPKKELFIGNWTCFDGFHPEASSRV